MVGLGSGWESVVKEARGWGWGVGAGEVVGEGGGFTLRRGGRWR